MTLGSAVPIPPPAAPVVRAVVTSDPLDDVWTRDVRGHVALAGRMLGDAQDAREAVQEAWVRAWSSRSTVRDEGAVRGWVRTIVVRECLRRLRWRRAQSWLTLAALVPDRADPRPAIDDRLDDARRLEVVRRAVDRLPPRQRLMWGLRFDEGWSIAAIAQATGVSPETVKTQLVRALKKVGAHDTM